MADEEKVAPPADVPAPAARTRRKKGSPAAAETRDGLRMILKKERVLVLPEDISDTVVAEVLKKVNAGAEKRLGAALKTAPVDAWVVIGEHAGASKEHAIRAYTGPEGEPDTKVGTFKAPPATGWKGGLRMKAPPRPKVESEAID